MKCDFKLYVELFAANACYEKIPLIHRLVLILYVLEDEKHQEGSLAAWG